jgi:peptidoglycan/xylan/chitin deacetylase (PgdA/CDA1 family)
MLKHKITIIIAGLLLAGLLAYFFIGKSMFVPVITLFVIMTIIFYGSAFINSNFYINTVCFVNTQKKQVALTFDDGPDEKNTDKILDVLDKHGVKAAFFCVGNKIETNKDLLKSIVSRGHIVGNHSYHHSVMFSFFSVKKTEQDLVKNHGLIFETTGKHVRYFRPPNGVTNPTLRQAVDKLNYAVIGWNVRTFDTVNSNGPDILAKLKKTLKPGNIILLHDATDNIDGILNDFLDYLTKTGYESVPLDLLTGIKAYKD